MCNVEHLKKETSASILINICQMSEWPQQILTVAHSLFESLIYQSLLGA